jgi:hypothetical protein
MCLAPKPCERVETILDHRTTVKAPAALAKEDIPTVLIRILVAMVAAVEAQEADTRTRTRVVEVLVDS